MGLLRIALSLVVAFLAVTLLAYHLPTPHSPIPDPLSPIANPQSSLPFLGINTALEQYNPTQRQAALARLRATGFGWVRAKPACSMAPVAVTPDELGPNWRDARVDLPLLVDRDGTRFGAANGYAMSAGFDDLVAHAAYSRDLVAGTVIGSGTVSNENYREIGSSCIAERRGIEKLDTGEPTTPFLHFGERVRMECLGADGQSLFGAIDQKVVKA